MSVSKTPTAEARIQDRLAGAGPMPKRQNLSVDVPPRGFVLYADCERR